MSAYPFSYLRVTYKDENGRFNTIKKWAVKNLKDYEIIALSTDNDDIKNWWNAKMHNSTIDRLCEMLWKVLEDVTCDEDDNVTSDWWIFEKGTSKMHIWHWFEDTFHDFMAGEACCTTNKELQAGYIEDAIANKLNDNFDDCLFDDGFVKENVPSEDILSLAAKYPFESDSYSEWDDELQEHVFPYIAEHLQEKACEYAKKNGIPFEVE